MPNPLSKSNEANYHSLHPTSGAWIKDLYIVAYKSMPYVRTLLKYRLAFLLLVLLVLDAAGSISMLVASCGFISRSI